MSKDQIRKKIEKNENRFKQLDIARTRATNEGDWDEIQRLSNEQDAIVEENQLLFERLGRIEAKERGGI